MRNHYYLLAAAFLGLVVSSCTSSNTAEIQVQSPSENSSEFQRSAVVSPAGPAQEDAHWKQESDPETVQAAVRESVVRFATYNVSLNRKTAGQLLVDLKAGQSMQFRRVAEVIQRVRPDVILLNEFDYDADGKSIELFREKYLAVSQNKQDPVEYPFHFSAAVNTGVDSGIDINGDGKVNLPDDGFGFGAFPGQYGMVVLSKYPIDEVSIRTFQNFLWKDLPGASLPIDPATRAPFYSDADFNKLRLSSKSLWDVPIRIEDKTIHLIASHPTPPVFDGPEDRNGCRNHNEIRIIADYVSGHADYLYDDAGVKGGLPVDASFVIAGDLNADPNDGDSSGGAAGQLTGHDRINHSMTPTSKGAVYAAETSAGKNVGQKGNHAEDTGDFNDEVTGNMRVDYCLPSINLQIRKSGVFWPADGDADFDLNRASDHHLVWIDIILD